MASIASRATFCIAGLPVFRVRAITSICVFSNSRVISAMVCFGLVLMKSSPRSFVISASLSSIRLFICPMRSPSKSAPWAWVLVSETCTTSSPRPFLLVGSTRREFSMLTCGSFHW